MQDNTLAANVHVRWMVRRDMAEVLEIESCGFGTPWSEDDFIGYLRQRSSIGMVAEVEERVVGFMIYRLQERGLHLVNFSVRPDLRRRGVGTRMVGNLVRKLGSCRRNKISLEVGEDNLAAQLFFRSLGFRAIRILSRYYYDGGQDAYRMEYHLGGVPIFVPANRISHLIDAE